MRALLPLLLVMAGPVMAETADLAGTWRPESVTAAFDAEMMQRAEVQIAADGALSGSGGCNRLTGSVQTGAGATIAFSVGTTLMFCPGGVMPLEIAFVRALEAARAYRLEGATLILSDGAGDELARLHRAAD